MSSSVQKEQIGDCWSHSLKSIFSKTVRKNKYGSVAEKLMSVIHTVQVILVLSDKPDIIIYGHYKPDEGDCREIYVGGI